jgi:pyrophosphate--fructose-6-phosphate 1-phosphotransferase
MQGKKSISAKDLLSNPEVIKITGNINPEIIERRKYKPPICNAFTKPFTVLKENNDFNFKIHIEATKQLSKIIDNKAQDIEGIDCPGEPLKTEYSSKRIIGIVFSGGPAPGGHNVIAGIYDAAKKANPESIIYGFLMGPEGIIENEAVELTDNIINDYRNLGGFSMIKTGRTKIDTQEKTALSKETCNDLNLDALVIVGGDDSNTNAAFLAQDMFDDGIQVIGVPKTIDGDVQVRDADGNVLCAISFGFHSAARAFASSISNLCTDCSSDVKYWHICKVMGRVASHLALEVALQTHANLTIIGEDLADYVDESRLEKARKENRIDYIAYGMTLRHLSRVICDCIVQRAAAGKNYGVIVLPEGVLEFINEIQTFIIKLNTIIAEYNEMHDTDFHTEFPFLENKLEYLRRLARLNEEENKPSYWSRRDDDLFSDIPDFFKEGLLMERDSHGNFPFSQVETDKVIMEIVQDYLNILKEKGIYKIGIERDYFIKTLKKDGVDPDSFGPVIFRNYDDGPALLLVKEQITSIKTLKHSMVKAGIITEKEHIPPSVKKIYNKSVPNFKTQSHFYGYDGRGTDPTMFDCNYTYNLGLTVFSLIAGGMTGYMAAIMNLEQDFDNWKPIGIPIAPLLHLEERKGRLALVMEKSLVDVNSAAFRVVKALRDKWLAAEPGADQYRKPGPIRFTGKSEEDKPITLVLNAIS